MRPVQDRAQYLRAIGAQPWYSRFRLVGAKATPDYLHVVRRDAKAKTLSPNADSVDVIVSPTVAEEPSVERHNPRPSLLEDVVENVRPEYTVGEEAGLTHEARADHTQADEAAVITPDLPTSIQLHFYRVDGFGVFTIGHSDVSLRDERQLLENVLQVFCRPESSASLYATFHWPVFSAAPAPSEGSQESYQATFKRFLSECNAERFATLITFGKLSAFAGNGAQAELLGRTVISCDTSISDVILNAALKPKLWDQLRATRS